MMKTFKSAKEAIDYALDYDMELIYNVNETPDFFEITGDIGGDPVKKRYYKEND